MLQKVTFPNPFGFPKPTKEEIHTHETLNSFLEKVEEETDYKDLNQLSLEELTEILISEDFGMMNFHAKSMNEFLANCFIIKDQTILIKDLEAK
ncbi:hypothetical protein [Empedobacter falsenii]